MPLTVLYLLYVNGNAKRLGFFVKRYAVRKAKIRPYAVRKLKTKQGGLFHSHHLKSVRYFTEIVLTSQNVWNAAMRERF